ncbi:transcriptional regulator [Enterobacter hormaechei]|nr:transcriptional regulator [Enterobacter hormaechei]
METQAIRQHYHCFVQLAGSWIKQMKEPAFHFACLSWRQGVGLGVGLAPNVTIMRLRDKAKSLRMRKVI